MTGTPIFETHAAVLLSLRAVPAGAALIDLEPVLERIQWLDRRERLPLGQMLEQAGAERPNSPPARLARWLRRTRSRMQLGPTGDTTTPFANDAWRLS